MADYSWWITIVRLLCFTAIIGIIATDTTRGLVHSKSALYATVLSMALWIVVAMDTLLHPPATLFSFSADSANATYSFEIAPIVLISGLLILLAINGAIAYKVGRKRGDIRGTKKQKIFQ